MSFQNYIQKILFSRTFLHSINRKHDTNMTEHLDDTEVLERTWQMYDDEFADHVGAVVTPYDYVTTEQQVEWAARVFMFGYGLGSVAGAQSVAPDATTDGTDRERVDAIVDHVVDIHASDAFDVSTQRVKRDFLEQ